MRHSAPFRMRFEQPASWRQASARLAAYGTLLSLPLTPLLSCAPAATTVSSAVAQRVPDSAPATLAADSVCHSLAQVLRAFGDTLHPGERTRILRNAPAPESGSNSQARVHDLSLLYNALREHGLTVLTVHPASYEALYALTSIPVLTALVVLHFDGREVMPLERDRLLSAEPGFLSECAGAIRIHVVELLRNSSGVYTLGTLDGLAAEGLPGDEITGQVFPVESPDGEEGYAQIVGHFLVSQLSRFDIDSHLDEWFRRLPYFYGVPRTRRQR